MAKSEAPGERLWFGCGLLAIGAPATLALRLYLNHQAGPSIGFGIALAAAYIVDCVGLFLVMSEAWSRRRR